MTFGCGDKKGLSFIELIVTVVILSVLAMLVLPMAQMMAKRTKELELRRDLREIRTAIDDYKKKYDEAVKQGKLPNVMDKSGYPETLDVLVEGYDFGGLVNTKVKFLRRIPMDPFHPVKGKDEPKWGLRSFSDKPDSTQWDEKDVFDVYSLSDETAIDGTNYKDW